MHCFCSYKQAQIFYHMAYAYVSLAVSIAETLYIRRPFIFCHTHEKYLPNKSYTKTISNTKMIQMTQKLKFRLASIPNSRCALAGYRLVASNETGKSTLLLLEIQVSNS